MVCSLLSSQTLKSLISRSRTYPPFLSVTTASTSTWRASARITTPESTGGVFWALEASTGRNRARYLSFTRTSSRNLDGSVARRHGLSFGIPDHQPDHIAARRHIDNRPHADPSGRKIPERLILQLHIHDLLNARHPVAIAIEQARDNRQRVIVAPFGFPVAQIPDIHLGDHRDLGARRAGLEELHVQIHRNVADFVPREDCLL